MERRTFLSILPLPFIAPKVVQDGVESICLPVMEGCHYILVADVNKVSQSMFYNNNLLPPGAKGAVLFVDGDPSEAVKFYKIKDA